MSLAIFKNNFKVDIAQTVLDEFSVRSNNTYFVFIGNITEWPDDNQPPANVDNIESELFAVRNSYFLKRILEKDVKLIINKFLWSPEEIYTQYDDIDDLFDESLVMGSSRFFILTPEYNVYKCLSNNNNALSTNMPTGNKTIPITTSDGYVWKYMFSLNEHDRSFVTSLKMPVGFAESTDTELNLIDQYAVQSSSVKGSFEYVELLDQGSPYLLGSTGYGLPVGRTEVDGSTAIQIIGLNSHQLNIYQGYTVKIVGGYGEGQIRTITSSEENTGILHVDGAWIEPPDVSTDATGGQSRAQVIPTINVFGDGTDLQVVPILNAEKYITGIEIVNKGQGYTTISYSLYPGHEAPYNTGDVELHRGTSSAIETTMNFVSAPYEGHGSDVRKELGATSLMLFIDLVGTEFESLGLTATNDFRQFGIIKNPVISDEYEGGIYAGKVAGKHVSDLYKLNVNQISSDDLLGNEDFNSANLSISGITATYVMGAVSNTSAKITEWTPLSTSQGVLTVEQPNGDFILNEKLSTYLQETVTGDDDTETTVRIINHADNEARYASITQDTDNLHLFNQTVRVSVDANAQTPEFAIDTFSEDEVYSNYITGLSGSSFRVLNWNVGTTGSSGGGNINGIDYNSGLKINDYIYSSSGTTMGIVTGVTGPDIKYNEGEVLYIQNMIPVQRENQQQEELKIQIGF